MVGVGFRLGFCANTFQVQRLDGHHVVGCGNPVGLLVLPVAPLVGGLLRQSAHSLFLPIPVGGAFNHAGESALLPSELVLRFPIVARIFRFLPVAGDVQSVRSIVQSDDTHGFHLFGRLGLALKQDGRRVPTGRAMFDGD